MNVSILRKTLRNLDNKIPDELFYAFLGHEISRQKMSRITAGTRAVWAGSDHDEGDARIKQATNDFIETIIEPMPSSTKSQWAYYLKEIIRNDVDTWHRDDPQRNALLETSVDDKFLADVFSWIVSHDFFNIRNNLTRAQQTYTDDVTSPTYATELLANHQKKSRSTSTIDLVPRAQINDQLSLAAIVADDDVEAIDVVALSCFYFVVHDRGRILFENAIDKGIAFRIAIAAPNSGFCYQQALDFIKAPKITATRNASYSSEAFQEYIEELTVAGKEEQLQLRYYGGAMPFTVFRVRYSAKNEKRKDVAKIVFYSLDTSDDERRAFICEEGSEHFDFYVRQFDIMWERSIPATFGG